MRSLFKSFTILVVALAGVSANAQNLHELKVDVPFSFTAAGEIHPPGEYHFLFNPMNAVVSVSGENSPAVFLMTAPSDSSQDGRSFLRFYAYGSSRVLTSVSFRGSVRRLTSGHSPRTLIAGRSVEEETIRVRPASPSIVLAEKGREN